MRIIQTRSNLWELEYDNGQRVLPGDIVRNNNTIPALFRGIANGHVELSELSDSRFEESPAARVAIGEFLDKFTSDQERLGQAGPIGIARDHPSHDEPKESQEPSVADIHRKMTEMRWAKESIAMAAVELNVAYAHFVITNENCEIPTGEICAASRRLEEAMQRLSINAELDPIPF